MSQTPVPDSRLVRGSGSLNPSHKKWDGVTNPPTALWRRYRVGRKVTQDDPDTGQASYEYNALGELTAQVDAVGNRIQNEIDARGRVWRKTVLRADGTVESQTVTSFDTAAGGLGQAASESITGTYTAWDGLAGMGLDFSRSYRYDGLGRPLGSTTAIDGAHYTASAQYDSRGRPWKARDASGRWSKTVFNARGMATAVCNSSSSDTAAACPASSDTYLRTLETDAWGHTIREQRGNSPAMEVTSTYVADNGRIFSICAGNQASCNLMDEGYAWDASGNLSMQRKEGRYLEEFTYDSLNRLKTGRLMMQDGVTANRLVQSFEYDAVGNLCRKESGGAVNVYSYIGRSGCGLGGAMNSGFGGGGTGPGGAHQVSNINGTYYYYDVRGNQTIKDAPGTNASLDRTIAYTIDDQAHEAISGTGVRTRFWYGSDGARYKREDGAKRTLYLGNVEIVSNGGVTTTRRTIAGVMLQTIVGGITTDHYLFHDQLGNLVKVTDKNGATINSQDYAAFGARRDYDDAGLSTTSAPTITTRGFTGHEMVDGVLGIIHMNGRIFDPGVGRFLQADPFIQAPDSAQSWNAYTYVFNNPYRYTDPTGNLGVEERQWLGAIITIVAVATQQYWAIPMSSTAGVVLVVGGGFVGGAVATQSLRGGLMGAFTSLAGAGFASIGGGGFGSWAMRTAGGGVLGSIQGGGFGHSFLSAGLTAAVMPGVGQISSNVARTITGAIVGGTISRVTGGKFANGAVTGAIMAAVSGRDRIRSVGARGASRASRASPTEAQKLDYQARVLAGIEEVSNRLGNLAADAYEQLNFADSWDFRQASNALESAEVVFDLDTIGPNGAEMEFGTGIVSRSTLTPRSLLTVYKGAYLAYVNGSPAAAGYAIDLSPGTPGLRGIITHESGHGVYGRNYDSTGNLLLSRESIADQWMLKVWPGQSF